ncbi:aryl-sulfate sulfotransferase [Gallaecimonas mangrovi]|uniref:aryl-sulfate sulfotransferase n=1 Tax=Gallaecimonas mangrovi TaxID=2291597 RepID=UPI000E20A7B6|nr:aryl-sulfate sulfotransferase [Gallaecimonas mangrovi]
MTKRCFKPAWVLACAALGLSAMQADAQATRTLSGTTLYNPQKAENGYVLFSTQNQQTYLIDMNGHEVHHWNAEGFPAKPVPTALAGGERGHVLVQTARVASPVKEANPGNGMLNQTIAELDWQGKPQWQWGSAKHPAYQHHDLAKLANGNVLSLNAELIDLKGFKKPVIDNKVQEINASGKVVWSWSAAKHLADFGLSKTQLAELKKAGGYDFLHINTAAPLGPNHWYDAGDKRFAPDNILINSRNVNVALIIDRHSGKVVWRVGPNYPKTQWSGKVPRPLDQIIGEHDVHMIPKGLPGAGNLLIFDNEGNASLSVKNRSMFSASRVIEVNPTSKQIVWQYDASRSHHAIWTFFSGFISSAQRLKNGNTLIAEGQSGRLFQVTPSGDIVWEYVNPHYGHSSKADTYQTNYVYRAYQVGYDWAPKGTPHSENAVVPDCAAQYPCQAQSQ